MLELLQEFYLKHKESKFVFSGEDFEKKMDKIFTISPFPKYKKQIIELLGTEEIVFGIEETVSGILFTNRFFLLVGFKLGPKRYDYPLFLQLELSPKTFTKNGKYILDGNDMCGLGTTSKDFIELFESFKNTISQMDFSNTNHDQINPREIMENNDSTSKTISSDFSNTKDDQMNPREIMENNDSTSKTIFSDFSKNYKQTKGDFKKYPFWKKGLIYIVFFLVLGSIGEGRKYYNKYFKLNYCYTDNMSMGGEYKEVDTDLTIKITFDSRDFKVGDIGSFTLTSSSSNKKIEYKGQEVEGRYTMILNKNTGNKEVVCTPISVDGKEINYNEVSLRFEVLVFGISNNNQTLTVISPGQHFHVNDSINVCE